MEGKREEHFSQKEQHVQIQMQEPQLGTRLKVTVMGEQRVGVDMKLEGLAGPHAGFADRRGVGWRACSD